MLLTGKSRKIYHEEGYPDRCESLDEFLQLEERLNDDEEYIIFACSCTFLFVFIYLKCFQDREHVIFYIFMSFVVNTEQVMTCVSESYATLTKHFGARLPYGHRLLQVWKKLKLKYFLENGWEMEKVTTDGCLFSTRE